MRLHTRFNMKYAAYVANIYKLSMKQRVDNGS